MIDASEPLPVAVLVSGTGTNLQALLDTVHGREAEIVAVASGAPGALALERAAAHGVPTAVFERSAHADRQARDLAMADWLDGRGVRLVVLAGYMELLSVAFLERFPAAVINVHPSLLPAFPGLHAIEQALAYGVKVFGVTVHFVDAGVDSGAVISQRAVELPDARDPEQVLAALRPLEHALLPETVRLFAKGALHADPENPRRIVREPRSSSATVGQDI
jgi:phosphoribosylglycinamide formyltransferase-1